MKHLITITIIAITSTAGYAQQYMLDVSESQLKWRGYGEIGGFVQEGAISAKSGSVEINEKSILAGTLIIDMKTIQHEDKNLEKHLKKKDFFYVNKYPTAELRMTDLKGAAIIADVTIRGITKSVEIPVSTTAEDGRVRISGTATIDRTRFEIKYNSSSYFQDLGSYAIKNEFDLEFDLVFIQ